MQLKAIKLYLPFKHLSFWLIFCMHFILTSIWLTFSVSFHMTCCCSILQCTLFTTNYSELRTFTELRLEWKLSEAICWLHQCLSPEPLQKSWQDNNSGSGCQCRDRMLSKLCGLKCIFCVVQAVRFKVFDLGKGLDKTW